MEAEERRKPKISGYFHQNNGNGHYELNVFWKKLIQKCKSCVTFQLPPTNGIFIGFIIEH